MIARFKKKRSGEIISIPCRKLIHRWNRYLVIGSINVNGQENEHPIIIYKVYWRKLKTRKEDANDYCNH